jgi:hypothetical protein
MNPLQKGKAGDVGGSVAKQAGESRVNLRDAPVAVQKAERFVRYGKKRVWNDR